MAGNNRGGRASSKLTRKVIDVYGPVCWLNLPGCTRVATTKDHVVPYSHGGTDDLENLRPCCRSCNSKRSNRVMPGHGATVTIVVGPPAAGKSTYVREHATTGDVVIDLDEIARAIMPIEPTATHVYPMHVRHVAIGMRKAAIDRATRLSERCTVWIIHAVPSPDQLEEYRRLRWHIITIDPGRDVVEPRVRTMRPEIMWPAVERWYQTYAPKQLETVGSSMALDHQPSRDW